MRIAIYSENGTPTLCKIPFEGDIKQIILNCDLGDESLRVIYDDNKNLDDARYKAGSFAGNEIFYEIYNKENGFNLLNNEE